jgi:hypothetical protein
MLWHKIYENKLWGGKQSRFFSDAGSHDSELVNPYLETMSYFLAAFKIPLVVDFRASNRIMEQLLK